MPNAPDTLLPTELIEIVLDILHEDRHIEALKACSLVNHVFCILSQTRLLRAISFRRSDLPVIVPEKFSHYYSVNSHRSEDVNLSTRIASHVRDYFSAIPHLAEDLDISPQLTFHVRKVVLPCQWIYEQERNISDHEIPLLESLLLGLPNLYHLSIPDPQRFRESLEGLYTWSSVFSAETSFQATLRSFFNRSTTLTELDLTGIQMFPGDIFHSCSRALKRLLVTTIEPPRAHTSEGRVPCTPLRIQLEYFRIATHPPQYSQSLLPWLCSPLCPLDLRDLRTLKIALVGRVCPESEKLFNLCPNVHHLMFDLMGEPSVYAAYNSLNYILRPYVNTYMVETNHGLTLLRHLTFEGALKVRTFHNRTFVDYFDTPLPWIIDMMGLIRTSSPSAMTLTQFTLKLVFIKFQMSLIPHLHNNWTSLSNCLRTFNGFSRLNLHIIGLPLPELTKLKEDEALIEMEKEGKLMYL